MCTFSQYNYSLTHTHTHTEVSEAKFWRTFMSVHRSTRKYRVSVIGVLAEAFPIDSHTATGAPRRPGAGTTTTTRVKLGGIAFILILDSRLTRTHSHSL